MIEGVKKDKINKYKLKEEYPKKLDIFIQNLDNNIKKDIENWSNTNR